MDNMKILITGSAGFVGKNIFHYLSSLHEVFGVSRRTGETTTYQGDITKDEIFNILDKINPNVIIHSAALTNVDYSEEHLEETWLQNVAGTWNLISWCEKNKKKMIYISTDYVYPGKINNYDEESELEPVNVYGKTKLAAEYLVKNLPNFAILRPTVIFGYDKLGTNFLMQMLNLKESRKICDDQISNPTDIGVLCEYVKRIINQDIRGLFVATGPETIDRYKFALLIADVFGLDKKLILKVKTSDLNQKAKRPLNNGTNSSKIQEVLNYNCPTLRESLEKIKSTL